MPRDGAKVRKALQAAALQLCEEQGFEATTVADIAVRAGVTERTFYRHFADRRDVLFEGEKELRDILVTRIAAADAQVTPLAMVIDALLGAVPLVEANRSITVPRAQIIAADPTLRERVGAKREWLGAELVAALTARGASQATAALAVDVGLATFSRGATEWFADPSVDLRTRLLEAVASLRSLAGTL